MKWIRDPELLPIAAKIEAGQRLTFAEGMLLYHDASPLEYRDFDYITRQDCCSWLYYQALLETQTVRQDKKIFFERTGGMADFKSATKTRKLF